jgi:DNA-binding beta-propeller fold protein YncE
LPSGLLFDRQGNLYVVDCGNDRIQKFSVDWNEKNLFELN